MTKGFTSCALSLVASLAAGFAGFRGVFDFCGLLDFDFCVLVDGCFCELVDALPLPLATGLELELDVPFAVDLGLSALTDLTALALEGVGVDGGDHSSTSMISVGGIEREAGEFQRLGRVEGRGHVVRRDQVPRVRHGAGRHTRSANAISYQHAWH